MEVKESIQSPGIGVSYRQLRVAIGCQQSSPGPLQDQSLSEEGMPGKRRHSSEPDSLA